MRRYYSAIALCVVGAIFSSSAVLALANVSRSFSTTDKNIVSGSLVSTEVGSSGNIELADTNNASRLVGVAVLNDQSLLASNTNKVQVAMNGTADVLVSTLGGDIHAGDQVAVSPISGVGMRAGNNMRSIGIAQGEFTASSSNVTPKQIKDRSGNTTSISLGYLPIVVLIGYSSSSTQTQQGILGSIQTIASATSGHSVSALQAILSFLITIIAIVALVALVYGAIHGSLISIGRNPLAKISIYRSLSQVMVMALLIVVVAVVVVYFTLR